MKILSYPEIERIKLSVIERIHFSQTSVIVLFQGPKIWNSLPMHIKAVSSFQSFKQLIKSLLRDKQDNVTQT